VSNVSRRHRGKPAARRANGTGSISPRSDGTLDVRISLPGGKRRRRVVRRLADETEAQHEKRAEAALNALLAEAEAGLIIPSGHTTVADYAQRWLEREKAKSAAGRGLAASTLSFYRQQFDYYINPLVGGRPLPELTTADVESMMDGLTGKGRSPRTVQAARNALGRVLRAAKRDGLVSKVVTDDASRIRRMLDDDEDATSKALDPESIRRLFEAAEGTQWEPLLATLAFLGLRRGEALGLSWRDLDLDAGTVTMRSCR